MEISVLFFGQLADITGTSCIRLSGVKDTETLDRLLRERYPLLEQRSYRIAVNRRMTAEKMALEENAEVALLPPFSGG
jgi:molybdopterin converting factor small subunit